MMPAMAAYGANHTAPQNFRRVSMRPLHTEFESHDHDFIDLTEPTCMHII